MGLEGLIPGKERVLASPRPGVPALAPSPSPRSRVLASWRSRPGALAVPASSRPRVLVP
jgi:hypothetical protein